MSVYLFLLSFAAFLLAAPSLPGKDSLSVFQSSYSDCMTTGDYARALAVGKEVLAYSERISDPSVQMLGYSYIGQAYLARDRYDSVGFYLHSGLDLWNAADSTERTPVQYNAIYNIYNGLGICAVNVDMDYEAGIRYFLSGLRLAERRGDRTEYAVFGSNLVVTYNLRRDTAGLRYALDVYRYGKRINDANIVYSGSYVTAMMYFLRGDLDEAERYLNETMSLSDRFRDRRGMDCLYARIRDARGDWKQAEEYYRRAVREEADESLTSAISNHLWYGDFLYRRHEYARALELLQKGIELAESKKNRIFTYQLYGLASACCEALGQPEEALAYYRRFHEESYDVYDLERERAVNELTRKYENERHEREIQEQSLRFMKKEHQLHLAVFVIVIVLAVSGITFRMYRHKNRLYAKIAAQYKEAIARQRAMEQQISGLQSQLQSNVAQADDKNEQLFGRLEDLMQQRKIYRERNLTREKVAEMIGSNRTYLSQVINEKTGKTFVHYVNAYRIDEALEVLSDPANGVPLKALSADLGFSSLTTFYTTFRDKVGMTPAKYRDAIIRLNKNDN